MNLCRWCAQEIKLTETYVGFGTGRGPEYVHTECFADYEGILNALSGIPKNQFDYFVTIHRTMIRSLERMYTEVVEKL